MKKFKCVYYQTDSGRIPVKEFIFSLYIRTRQKYYTVIDLLEEKGKKLPKPHSDFLGEDIYEIRFIGLEGKIRVFYFFYDEDKIILTNAFVKKTQKAPKKEIDLAKKRRKHYFRRKGDK